MSETLGAKAMYLLYQSQLMVYPSLLPLHACSLSLPCSSHLQILLLYMVGTPYLFFCAPILMNHWPIGKMAWWKGQVSHLAETGPEILRASVQSAAPQEAVATQHAPPYGYPPWAYTLPQGGGYSPVNFHWSHVNPVTLLSCTAQMQMTWLSWALLRCTEQCALDAHIIHPFTLFPSV